MGVEVLWWGRIGVDEKTVTLRYRYSHFHFGLVPMVIGILVRDFEHRCHLVAGSMDDLFDPVRTAGDLARRSPQPGVAALARNARLKVCCGGVGMGLPVSGVSGGCLATSDSAKLVDSADGLDESGRRVMVLGYSVVDCHGAGLSGRLGSMARHGFVHPGVDR